MKRRTLKYLLLIVLISATATANIDPAVFQSAEKGNASAQFFVGMSYKLGDGVSKDSTEAVKWFRKAAEQGHADAQSALGVSYTLGNGVQMNKPEGLKWFRKAAEQGEPGAQNYLGTAYELGELVSKNYIEAAKWYRKAAEQGHPRAAGNLGIAYAKGEGVPKDEVEGLAWVNIGATTGQQAYVLYQDLLERRLGNQLKLVAQERSKQILKEIETAKRELTPAKPKVSTDITPPASDRPKASGSGTIVTTSGHVLTAAHVVAGASSIKVLTSLGIKGAAVLRLDEANDLAVLKLDEGTYFAIPVGPSRRIRLGQTVATIGFPNIQIQGFSPKVTRGEVSSLNGIGDDPRAWQISVPVQTGNSGGPLLDEYGNLIGVIVSKLGMKAATVTGDLPQNVNYAVKSSYALALLEPYLVNDALETAQGPTNPRFEDMVAKAQQAVVLILVY